MESPRPTEIERWAVSSDAEDRRCAAEHPQAPAAVLRRLADDEVPEIRQAVARHPNTPLAVVLRLAEDHPVAVLQNPTRPMWAVEQPGFLSQMTQDALRALVEQESVPQAWLRWTVRQDEPEYREARQAILANSESPAEIVRAVWNRESQEREAVRVEVAEHPNTPASILSELFGAFQGESTGPSIGVARGVCRNPNTPTELLCRIASGPDRYLRRLVASNPSLPADVIDDLSSDSDEQVRKNVTANPALQDEQMEKLACDTNPGVRRRVARRADLPQHAAQLLAQDPDERVRVIAANHPRTPSHLRQWMAELDRPSIREVATRSLSDCPDDRN